MAIELATGYVSLTASAKGIGKSIQGELEGPLTKSGTKAGEGAAKGFGQKLKDGAGKAGQAAGLDAGDKAGKGFSSKLSSGLSAVPIGQFFAGAAVAGAVGAFVKSSVNAASALQESLSKTDAVFKGNAESVKKWAETASTSFGQSKQQALEAASTFGNLFQAFGVGLEPATEMSTTLTRLASDLASFNNTSVQEAVEALRSGLSGETEPLKRYGVALTDARLKQEALGQGLISDVKQPLDAAAKSQAAYALIMKDTALAQGDFERTSDGFANTMRTLQAQVSELQAEFGEALLPTITEVTAALIGLIGVANRVTAPFGGLSKTLSGIIAQTPLIGGLSNLGDVFRDGASGVDRFGGAVGFAVPVLGNWIQGLDNGKESSAALTAEMGQISRGFASAHGGAAGYAAQMQAVSNANNQVADSVSLAREGVRTYGQALRDANAALQEHLNLTLSAVDSSFAATAAQNAFTTAVEAANVASDDLSTGVNEQQVAMDGATQSAVAAAEAAVRLAQDQAKATGATYTAEDAQTTLIGTLMDLASRSNGPVAAAIGGIITKLQTVGQQKPKPDLDVNPAPANSKIDDTSRKARAFAETRASAVLDADASRFNAALNRAYDRLRQLRLTNVGTFGLAGGARNWRGGWTMVGEKGPELVNLPRGSDVYTAAQSAAMIGTGSAVAAPAQALVISGNTFIGSGPEVTRLLSAKISEGRRAGVQFLGT